MITARDVPSSPGPVVWPVVVVGGGPTGITAATLLAQRGVRSLVLERFTEIYPLPRAVHLDDEAVRILQQVGIAQQFIALSRPGLGLRLLDARMRVMAEFGRAELIGVHGYPQANMFDQPELEALLRENLAAHPGVCLRTGAEVLAVTQPPIGPAPVLVEYRADGGEVQQVWAHAVLGCDGANSLTRTSIGAAFDDLRFSERWFVVDVRCPVRLDTWNGVHQVCDPARAATFMQIGDDRYRWEFRMHEGESATDLAQWSRLSSLLAPWTHGVDADQLTVLRATDYTFRARLADRWRRDRVFVLGDAAHLTPPFIGQGLASGLRDAHNLAWKLATVLNEGADDRLLDTYQSERRPHARALIRLAVTTGWAMTGGQDRAATVRRLLLTALCRVPGFTDVVGRGTTPRLHRGPLVRRRRGRVFDLAGTLCPQPWVGADGQRLDDVLGGGFAVVADAPLDASLTELAHRLGAGIFWITPPRPSARGAILGRREATSRDRDGVVVISGDAAVTLRRWMRRAAVSAVVLRPDRVVLVACPRRLFSRPVGPMIAHRSRRWRDLHVTAG